MNKLIGYIFLVSVALFGLGCQEDPEPGGTATQDVAGEWWVKVYVDNGTGTLVDTLGHYIKVMTFNTANNSADSIWVSDLGNYWDFQIKVPFDKTNKAFSISEGANVSYDSKVTIANGAILLGQGMSTSGVKTDSIYFITTFSDDEDADENPAPYGTEYIMAGHRRTGFLEDEHE